MLKTILTLINVAVVGAIKCKTKLLRVAIKMPQSVAKLLQGTIKVPPCNLATTRYHQSAAKSQRGATICHYSSQ